VCVELAALWARSLPALSLPRPGLRCSRCVLLSSLRSGLGRCVCSGARRVRTAVRGRAPRPNGSRRAPRCIGVACILPHWPWHCHSQRSLERDGRLSQQTRAETRSSDRSGVQGAASSTHAAATAAESRAQRARHTQQRPQRSPERSELDTRSGDRVQSAASLTHAAATESRAQQARHT